MSLDLGQGRDLAGRVALVTGAGGGVGGAAAEHLAARGATVIVNDTSVDPYGVARDVDAAAATVARIEAAGGIAVADHTSVADTDAVTDMVRARVAELGGVDILLSCAGVIGRDLEVTDEAAWDLLLDTHVAGHLNLLDAVLPGMAARGWGRVVNVTSGAGLQRAGAVQAVYSTAKRAIAALTWALGREAPAGVTVNALSPLANTAMVRIVAPPPGPASTAAPTGGLDLGNMPSPASLMPLVAWFCSERSAWLSGQVLFTNGVEVTAVAAPRLLEVVHADGESLDGAVEALLAPAARANATTGGTMARRAARTDG